MPQPFPWLQQHEVPYRFPLHPRAAADHAPDEGTLALDVHETTREIIVTAPIAGVRPEDIDVSVTHDTVTIRGERRPAITDATARSLATECHWGMFSRTVVLPETVKTDEASAAFQNGILTIRLPKNPDAGRLRITTLP